VGAADNVLRHYGKTSAVPGEQCTLTIQRNGVDIPGFSWTNVCIGSLGWIPLPDQRSADVYLNSAPIEINPDGTIGAMADFLCSQDVSHLLEQVCCYPNHPHAPADISTAVTSYEGMG